MASHFNIFALERRQDPDEPTTTSVTTDTSGAVSSVVVPTSSFSFYEPYLSSIPEHKNTVPKIGGSEGGFIGLVVGLGVIFIGSCIGIFLLLRHRPHGGRRTLKKSGRVGEESDFPHRRGTLFGFRSRAPGRDGWMRTGGDEWDSDMEEWNVGGMSPERQGGAGSHRMMDTRRGHARTQGTNAEHSYGNVPKHRASPSSAGLVEPDRVTDSPEPSPDDDNFHDPSALFRDDEHHRNISIDSAATVVSSTTFPGGTKFKEAL